MYPKLLAALQMQTLFSFDLMNPPNLCVNACDNYVKKKMFANFKFVQRFVLDLILCRKNTIIIFNVELNTINKKKRKCINPFSGMN